LADFNLDNTSIGLLIALPTLRLSALPFAGDQVNAVLLVPAERLNHDFGKRPLARQHRGQKYVVVARVRLAADHGNVEAGRGARATSSSTVRISRHSVADDHQPRSLQAV
jgi:hypothetical protein